ncbi:MAG: hypothetical protein JKY65_07760, partial [Planctomycetes bacterium]|nr:hypothetical protein [Planctomycetota bacterium]
AAAVAQFAREGRFAEPVLIEIADELSADQRARLAPYLPKPAPPATPPVAKPTAKAAGAGCCKE